MAPVEESAMPLSSHLEELRWRIVWAVCAVALAFVFTYALAESLFDFLTRPLIANIGDQVQLIGTGVTEAFFTKLKVSFIGAVFLASPAIFYQIWSFVAPGLYESEKNYARPFVAAATFFFLLGAAFCYFVVFPVAFHFFVSEFESIGVSPALRITEYLSFSSRMLLAFGAIFELPVFTFFLARVGLVNHTMMIEWARYAAVGSFVIAAIMTPADAASQFLMAGPLLILYGLSIGVAYFVAKPEDTEAEEADGRDNDPGDDEGQ